MKGKHYIALAALTVAAVLAAVALSSFLRSNSFTLPFRSGPKAVLSSGRLVAVEELKTPLTASVGVRRQGGIVSFSLLLRDAADREVRSLELPGGRPKPPRVEVFDGSGKPVYACTLAYG